MAPGEIPKGDSARPTTAAKNKRPSKSEKRKDNKKKRSRGNWPEGGRKKPASRPTRIQNATGQTRQRAAPSGTRGLRNAKRMVDRLKKKIYYYEGGKGERKEKRSAI